MSLFILRSHPLDRGRLQVNISPENKGHTDTRAQTNRVMGSIRCHKKMHWRVQPLAAWMPPKSQKNCLELNFDTIHHAPHNMACYVEHRFSCSCGVPDGESSFESIPAVESLFSSPTGHDPRDHKDSAGAGLRSVL